MDAAATKISQLAAVLNPTLWNVLARLFWSKSINPLLPTKLVMIADLYETVVEVKGILYSGEIVLKVF